MPKNTRDVMEPNPPFAEFLNTIPSPLVAVLVGLAPFISTVRHVIDIFSWKAPWEESWLTIALWWAACLLGDVALRYVLPIAMLAVLFIARWSSKHQTTQSPVTEDSLQRTIADLSAIRALLPHLPATPSTALPVLLRVSATLYVPYLALTYLVRLRILVGIAGTIALTWRARWATLIRRGLWRSAWIRWSVYHAWARLSGQPLPPRTISPQSLISTTSSKKSGSASQASVNSIRFLFTVYENQRWWMGLDWTAALLPGERPSWCSTSQLPVAPPSAFALPAATTVYIMEGKTRMKRTAQWRWEEEEWRVLAHKEGSDVARIERPLPKDEITTSAGANRILKAAGKMRQASMSGSGGEGSPERQRGDEGDGGKVERSTSISRGGEVDEELSTDADGWVYGDNKWEGGSGKGGMGKYTRYRRWTRIAVLSETIEPVGPGEVGIQKEARAEDVNHSQAQSQPTTPIDEKVNGSALPHNDTITATSPCEDERNRLRQRLQSVVKRTTTTLGGHIRTDSTVSTTSDI